MAFVIVGASAGGCGSEEHCSALDLAVALSGAASGDEIEVGACSVTGRFHVPPGVTLRGTTDGSKIVAPTSKPAIEIHPAAGTVSRVSDLSIETSGAIGIITRGPGAVAIERVRVRVTSGVGIGAEGLDSINISDVTITGPIDVANPPVLPPVVTPTVSASHGLILADVEAGEIADLTVTGIAAYGVLLVDSNTSWNRGSASGNLGVGLMVEGGSSTLTDIELCKTSQGFSLVPAYGAVFSLEADVRSSGLRLCENQGVGLVQVTGTGQHLDVDATKNAVAAIWTEQASMFEVSGAISENNFAGLVAVESDNIVIRDAQINRTAKRRRVVGVQGEMEVGDGVQLVRTKQSMSMRDVTLTGNERAGILVQLDDTENGDLAFTNVSVTVSSMAEAAAVAQGTPPMGWDAGITRNGTDAQTDAGFAGTLSSFEVIGPCDRPRQSALRNDGLVSLTGF